MENSLYEPIFNYTNYEFEDKEVYLERIRPLLPNFPEEVIIQWFYDHSQQISDHEWLNYPSLKFEIKSWKIKDIPTKNFGNVEAIETYRYNYFNNGVRTQRTERLAKYFLKNGTWPVPPIFLDNKDGKFKYPHGYPCGIPYHLLEGHHRMAFFLGFMEKIELADEHFIYMAYKTDASDI